MPVPDTEAKACMYAGCRKTIPSHHYLCSEHYDDYISELIDQCPKCGRYKVAGYKYCSDCRFGRPVKQRYSQVNIPLPGERIPIEYSKTWEKSDREAVKFFVYILKLDNGKFYIGQSNDLRARLSEHRDGEAASTKGLNPRLKYFEMWPTRDSVAQREAELKGVYDKSPRQIRRMVIEFGELVSEMEAE